MRRNGLIVFPCLVVFGLVGSAAAASGRAAEFAKSLARTGRAEIRLAGEHAFTLDGMDTPIGFDVTLGDDGRALMLKGSFPATGKGPGAKLRLKHRFEGLRHLWIPHLTPADDFVIGDHAFRSPALIFANDKVAVALVPDLDDVGRGYGEGWRTWLDYDHAEQMITLAAGNYETFGHVFYRQAEADYRGQTVELTLHMIASRAPEDLANPYGMAARWLWERWGRRGFDEGGSQRAPLSRYADYVCRWAFSEEGWGETVWQEFEIDGRRVGAPAFIVDVAQHPSVPVEERRWREQRSIWNQAWFSTQRCANGLWLHGKQTGSDDLTKRAALMTALALAAPQTGGLFPSVYTTAQPGQRSSYQLYQDTPGWDQGRWTNSDRRPAEASAEAIHLLDAAFTAKLLLEWQDIVGKDPRILEYVERFADRLVRLQLESGAYPGWVEPDGEIVPTLAEGPESAMGATLLLKLARVLDKPEYTASARRALAYLETGPVAEGRWEDFETYFSCNSWGREDLIGKKFAPNGVYKQNTLSIYWGAEAFLEAYRSFNEPDDLAVGRRCLDELSLQQQVWDPPFIAAPCHGGWGVMNTDGEWNDARQSLFAPLYFAYYQETGEEQYIERGISAVRASFAMMYCPENEQVSRQYEMKHPSFGAESYGFMMENIAHVGPAPPDGSAIGPFTIYTWGNGAALATAAIVRERYGDIYIDSRRKRAFGIDGCRVRVYDDRVRVRDRYDRDALRVIYADGSAVDLKLRGSEGEVPLQPLH